MGAGLAGMAAVLTAQEGLQPASGRRPWHGPRGELGASEAAGGAAAGFDLFPAQPREPGEDRGEFRACSGVRRSALACRLMAIAAAT